MLYLPYGMVSSCSKTSLFLPKRQGKWSTSAEIQRFWVSTFLFGKVLFQTQHQHHRREIRLSQSQGLALLYRDRGQPSPDDHDTVNYKLLVLQRAGFIQFEFTLVSLVSRVTINTFTFRFGLNKVLFRSTLQLLTHSRLRNIS